MEGLAAVVLAGGTSRRMGRDKAMLHWRGGTLVSQTVSTVRSRCEPVIVVGAAHQDLGELDAVIVVDELPFQGPLPALAQGLRVARQRGALRAFVCAVDMPLLVPDLIDELTGEDADVSMAVADGRDHFLAAVYRTDLHTAVDAFVSSGERRLGVFVESLVVQRIRITRPQWVTNVNTEDELRAIAELP